MSNRKASNPALLVGYLSVALALAWPENSAAQQTPIGKYLCIVDHMAGIRFAGGNTIAGSFRPDQDRFFLTIRNATPLTGCPNLFAKNSLLHWFSCEATSEAQMDGGPLLRGDGQN